MASFSTMRGGRGRKLKSEINVVPYIDVMLVLLIIFMVTAPITNPNAIKLPTAARSSQPPAQYIQINLRADETAAVGIHDSKGKSAEPANVPNNAALLEQLTALHRQNPDYPVLMAADKKIRYELVVKAISDAKKIGFARVALATN